MASSRVRLLALLVCSAFAAVPAGAGPGDALHGGRQHIALVAKLSKTSFDQFLLRLPGVEVRVEEVAAIPCGPNSKFEFIAVEPEI